MEATESQATGQADGQALVGAIGSDAGEIKTCCAAVYSSDWARLLLGDSFHPGGLELTEHLGATLGLRPGMRVLDVASGAGASAIALVRRFGCEIVGVDYGAESVRAANAAAEAAGVAQLARFVEGDAEALPVEDGALDAVICECAFCTFPSKAVAASEFARVLRPGGQVGLTDLSRQGEIPADLRTLLAWVACIADAQPVEEYRRYLEGAGLTVTRIEPRDEALAGLIQDIRTKLLGAELMVRLKKVDLPNVDFEQAKTMARAAADAVKAKQFGYVLMTATKPA